MKLKNILKAHMLSTKERRQEIINLTQEQGRVEVDKLALSFGVSTVTVRGDLNYLSKKNLLVRSHGGAIAVERLSLELSISEKHDKNHTAKEAIGKAAANLIKSGESIILDSGTTTLEIAKCLHEKDKLVVMTNGLNIATELAKSESTDVLLTGGSLRKKSFSFYGRHAEEGLKNYHFDKLFLGVDGFDLDKGITTHFEPEAYINRKMCECSSEVIAVTDSSKFGKFGFHFIRHLEGINALVTDNKIPERYVKALKLAGVILHIVDI
jgi:DeoR family transcriptional regulator of aga operon